MTSNMPLITIGYGSILIVIGLVGYFATGQASVTALIPAFLGFIAEICGLLARNERFLKHAMHGAAMVGLLGTLGTLRVVPQLPSLFDGSAERPAAVLSQGLTLLLSAIFVMLCVRSFIEARRAREAEG
ncbi:MAG: hypothetical protein MPN21_28230 [Thermoanaerobaculia bacterium]|nr:hypothetical protein [Thermoanaerobaculia bacterium]